MKTAQEWGKEYNNKFAALDKSAEETVGEGVVPQEDIHEIIIKEIQLDAFKAGMQKATENCQALADRASDEGWPHTRADALNLKNIILLTASNMTVKDIP